MFFRNLEYDWMTRKTDWIVLRNYAMKTLHHSYESQNASARLIQIYFDDLDSY